jgi:hypothetical protein
MTAKRKDMSCAEFNACMAELIAAGQDIFAHPHLRRCKLHRALLDDLEAIAKAAREMFPEVDPPDTLWDGIQARLGQEHPAPIVSDLWPGYQVVFAMKVIERCNPDTSPPARDHSLPEKDLPMRLKVFQTGRSPARREGRR